MNTSQIKSFLAAGQYLNFTRAAESLYITQSVLSRHIAALEMELSAQLFVRDRNRIYLTKAGQIFYDEISQMMEHYNSVVKQISMIHEDSVFNLQIGVPADRHFGSLIGKVIYEVQKDYLMPNSIFSSFTTQELIENLLDGCIDIMFNNQELLEPYKKQLNMRLIYKDRVCLVVPVDHPLLEKENLCLKDFKDSKFIIVESPKLPLLARNLREYCHIAGASEIIVSDMNSQLLLLEAGVGIAILDPWHLLRANNNFRFLQLPELREIQVVAAWKKGNESKSIKYFLKVLDSLNI